MTLRCLVLVLFLVQGCHREPEHESIERALSAGDVTAVEALLKRGESPNRRDQAGRTLLVAAVQLGNKSLVDVLLENGADPDEPWQGIAPIVFAADPCNLPLVRSLLVGGAKPDAPDPNTDITPLMRAAARGSEDCVRALLDAGASATAVDHSGSNVAYHAALGGDVVLMRFVASLDVSLDLPNKYGVTPIMIAAAGGYVEVAEFLIGEGVDLCAVEGRDRTPREIALQNNREELVSMLPACGRD